MKNLKKVLSVLLVVAMLATAMVPAFAAETFTYETQAKALYDIGLFKGTSATEFVPELGGDLTREQGIAMIVRLLGKADAAAAVAAADQDKALAAFADAKDVEATLKATLAYAVKNGLVKGDGTSVNPKGKMIGKDFATILLRNLGYEVAAADYDKASATLAEKGGLTAAQAVKFNDKELIRDDFVGMSYGALKATYKTGETVIAKLITDKVVTEDAAVKANIITKAVLNVTAKATGAKKITVNFGAAVDTSKVTVTVKKGTVANTVAATTWATDKKSAVVELSSKLTEGDYTVSVAGLADKATDVKITAADEEVTKIVFDSDKAVLLPNDDTKVKVSFTVYNQYNEDVTKAYYGSLDPSGSGKDLDVQNGTFTTTHRTGEFEAGDTITLSLLHPDSGVFVSSTFTVVEKAQVSTVSIEKLYNEDNDVLDVNSDFGEFMLLFKFKDQYGNDVTDDAYLAEDVYVSTSNDDVADFAKTTKTIDGDVETVADFQTKEINDEDVVTLALAKLSGNEAGTATFRVISKLSGKIATFDVVVKDSVKPKTLTMQAPDLAVAGEKVVVPFTAIDQFGDEITDVEDLLGPDGDYVEVKVNVSSDETGITSSDVRAKFVQNPVTDKAELVLDLTNLKEEAKVTLTSTVEDSSSISRIAIPVEELAKPTTITALSSSFYTKVVTNGKASLDYAKFTVKDQYARDITAAKMRNQLIAGINYTAPATGRGTDTSIYTNGQYRFVVSSANTAKVDVIGKNTDGSKVVIGADVDKVYLYGVAEGSATITVQMEEYTGSAWAPIEDCDYDFTMSVVDLSDISKFEINTPTKGFDVQKLATVASVTYDTYKYMTGATATTLATSGGITTSYTSYDKGITVTGVLADGSKVTVPYELGRNYSDPNYAKAYEVMTAYEGKNVFFDKSKTTELAANQTVYNKELRVIGLTDDEDEVTVPYVVTVKGKTTVSLNGTLTVAGENPKITALSLVNNYGVAVKDSSTVVVKKAALDTLYTKYGSADRVIARIVADAVKAVDQYGNEHGDEFNRINDYAADYDGDFYKIVTSNMVDEDEISISAPVESGDSFDVTVFSSNNAQAIAFTVIID